MATRSTHRSSNRKLHPWRPLTALTVILLVLFGTMAALNSWTPKLGLDLQGGTTITLTASNTSGSGSVDPASLEQARTIIQQRVDSLGVGESEVTTAGNDQITVSVPNVSQDRLRDMVGQTAQLGFRVVYYSEAVASPTASPEASASPGASASPQASATGSTPQANPSGGASASATPQGNNLPTAAPSEAASTDPAAGLPSPSPYPTEAGQGTAPDQALSWQPTNQDAANFLAYTCGDPVVDTPDQPLITCDREGTAKYLLGPTVISGNQITTASAGIPQGQLQWVVSLSFDDAGTKLFGDATTQLYQGTPSSQFAIVLDGKVVSAPQVTQGPILTGQATIDGGSAGFTQEDAQNLASVLKYGALPLAFSIDSVDTVSPVLGGEQLTGAIIAGLLGLGLVVVFAVLIYRALSVVTISSLVIAAALTYALMVLLGESLGVALNLPGVAGGIVGIGVTADSFIILYERVKDEVRAGRTVRSAVESGWVKARGTILISDGVQMLSAVVLFVLSIGAVRGFAFILGLSTIIDIVVTFMFSKPLMTVLMRSRFFRDGHRWSGLEASTIGVEELPGLRPRTVPATSGEEA